MGKEAWQTPRQAVPQFLPSSGTHSSQPSKPCCLLNVLCMVHQTQRGHMEVKFRVWETEYSSEAQTQGLIRSFHCRLVRLATVDNVTRTRNRLYLVLSPQSPRRTQSAQSPNVLTLQALQMSPASLAVGWCSAPRDWFQSDAQDACLMADKTGYHSLEQDSAGFKQELSLLAQVFSKPRSQCQALST